MIYINGLMDIKESCQLKMKKKWSEESRNKIINRQKYIIQEICFLSRSNKDEATVDESYNSLNKEIKNMRNHL